MNAGGDAATVPGDGVIAGGDAATVVWDAVVHRGNATGVTVCKLSATMAPHHQRQHGRPPPPPASGLRLWPPFERLTRFHALWIQLESKGPEWRPVFLMADPWSLSRQIIVHVLLCRNRTSAIACTMHYISGGCALCLLVLTGALQLK